MDTKRICNVCGRELGDFDLQQDFHLHRVCGYGSKYDLTELDITFCSDCFDHIVDSCVVSPVVREVSIWA